MKARKNQQNELKQQLRALFKDDPSFVCNLFEENIKEIVEERIKNIRQDLKREVINEILEEMSFVTNDDVDRVRNSVQDLYEITEKIETKLIEQEGGVIITNVDSVENFRALCEDENSNICKQLDEFRAENEDELDLTYKKVGRKALRFNISTIASNGVKNPRKDLEKKLRKNMKEKYNSVVQNLKKGRTEKYFMKPNKSFIARKKGQLVYNLVEKIKKEHGDCEISWKNGHIILDGVSVDFVRSPGMLSAISSYCSSEVATWQQ